MSLRLAAFVFALAVGLVACTPAIHPRFAYVTNGSDGTLSVYSVDAATGMLRARAIDADSGALAPIAVSFDIAYGGVVEASGRFLYLATDFDDTLVAYALNAASGALADLAGSPFATQTDLVALTATATVR